MRMLTAVRCTVALACCSLGAACVFGPRAGSFGPANSPNGVAAKLDAMGKDNTVEGELLEVRDTGLVVLDKSVVTYVPYRIIQTGSFRQLGVSLYDGHPPTANEKNRLRMASRFPQGLTRETERQLLGAYHQTSITVLSPR